MNLEQRLRKLERQNQWLRRGLVSLLVLTAMLGILGAGSEKVPDVVKAREFQVIGEEGRILVKLSVLKSKKGDGGAVITSHFDRMPGGRISKAKPSSMMGGDSRGGTVGTFDTTGTPMITLQPTPRGGSIRLANDRGRELLTLGPTTRGKGVLTTFSNKGEILVELGKTEEGRGLVVAHDPASKLSSAKLTPVP